jgi:hypothetical protein
VGNFSTCLLPALLAFANILTCISPARRPLFARPSYAFALSIVAIIEWELVAPYYSAATADPLDVPAYLLGTMLYVLIGLTAANAGKFTVTALAEN